MGYVGKNMVDVVAVGEIFASPFVRTSFVTRFGLQTAAREWRSFMGTMPGTT